MDLNKLCQSKAFKITLWIVGGLAVALIVFKAGVEVGYRRANFSYRWGEKYHQNFGGPRGGFFEDDRGQGFINAYGNFSQIIKIDGQNLVVKGGDNAEKIVTIGDKTVIHRLREVITADKLAVGDSIVVIGEPDDQGRIQASLIRVMPTPPPVGAPMPGPFPPSPRH